MRLKNKMIYHQDYNYSKQVCNLVTIEK